jgi:ribonuclease E
MPRKMLIDATHAEETRVVVVDGTKVDEFDFETVNKRQIAGNIYLAKVTRVEPSLQAAFVDYGGNRHGFLAFSEIHPDYYQIPVEDREALIAEENRLTREEAAEAEAEAPKSGRTRRRRKPAAAESTGTPTAEIAQGAADSAAPASMTVVEPEGTPAAEDPDAQAAPAEDDADESVTPKPAEGEGIESVAAEDMDEDIRRPRKVRTRRYKISEVIKVRQILLVQVVKEERGTKGAALTTYLSLAGRYCVLMPNTARGGGISRKITNATHRKKLKDIAGEIEVPEGAGLIIRTAGAERTRAEIKRDYEYLLRLWEQIRDLTLKSIAPAQIYEEGNLIKRAIRDLYARDIDEVLVEGDAGYRLAKDFMKMLMPSHAKNVQHYADPLPLFARYQVESYLSSMFNPTVQLKSGGYIVIGITEALVAIDVNSGRATKEGSIEETAFKTNLEAADEVARQLAAARPRRADRDRLHRHGRAPQQHRRREAAEGQAQDRPRPYPDRQDIGLWPAGDEPAAVASRHAGGLDRALPALPWHRADPVERFGGAVDSAPDRGGGRARPRARDSGSGAGRGGELSDQSETGAYRADRGTLRDFGPGGGRCRHDQPRPFD